MKFREIGNLQKFAEGTAGEVVMGTVNELFLQALCASLEKRTVDWEDTLTPEQWNALFHLASVHHVLPLIYEAVVRSDAARQADPQLMTAVKRQSMQLVMLQTRKTSAFLKLLPALISAGVTPLVVKGITCRELYPNPDYRLSGDEDVLIPEEQFALCHEAMLSCGMELADAAQDLKAFEVSYRQQGSKLHIELHRQLFSPDADAYADFNRFFDGVHERAITQNLQGASIPTMNHTDHLFYLICHAFKHFLHGGFGIRQVCDICLYANIFGAQIQWQLVKDQCKMIRADLFAAALFRIGEKHLTFRPDAACYPEQWRTLAVDENPMLEDLIDSGVFGGSSMSRKHSSNMTLQAVSAGKQGKKVGNTVMKTVFPSARELSGRYPYLKERPYLLPVAWADRIVKYGRETAGKTSGNSAAESIRIGNERIELLKQYGIIDR